MNWSLIRCWIAAALRRPCRESRKTEADLRALTAQLNRHAANLKARARQEIRHDMRRAQGG